MQDQATIKDMPAKMAKRVRHLRHIVLWPIYLLPLDENAPIQDHWEHLTGKKPGNPWHEIDDEFGDPAEFQERHYHEFVTFLPPVQRFLYGQGLGRSVKSTYGESPIACLRRTDIAKVRVTLAAGDAPIVLDIAHVDLHFFFDIDVALLALEVSAKDIDFDQAQDLLFRFGRAYPAYWDDNGDGGHCPNKVEWLSAEGAVLATSDYERREKFLGFVCKQRAPCISSHWEYVLSPLVLHHSDKQGVVRFRLLEYYRMPYMAFLAFDDPTMLTRGDLVRLAHGTGPGDASELPFSPSYLKDFEERVCYDRDSGMIGEQVSSGARFMANGHTLVVVGDVHDKFFMQPEVGVLARFRHQHFLLFLVAHFQKAALRMFSDRLVATVSKLDIADAEANRTFRRNIRFTLENFLRFAHRYWFHEISNHAQTRELFEMTRGHLKLDDLYSEVREELQDMANFLDVEATRRQNETVVRLTVVTILGLIGTVTTGFIGMNIFDWTGEPAWWRAAMVLCVFVPVAILTFYTVIKSRRLSEFLDVLSDEKATFREKLKSLWRVWWGK